MPESPPDAAPSTELLHAALEKLDAGVIVADAEGKLVFVNDAAARMHGLAPLGIQPDAYAEAYRLFTLEGDEYPTRDLPLSRAVLNGEIVRDAQWRVRRPDGTEVVAVGSARPLVDAAGRRLGAVLTVRDAQTDAEREAELRDRDLIARRLRAAFEQSPVSTVVYDAEGHPIAVNPAFEKLWGASLADVPPGYSVLSDPQLELAGVMPEIRRAFQGHASSIPPLRYEMADTTGRGRVLWTQAHLYPVRDADGAVEQVVLTHEDVTGRREADFALSRALERTQQLQTLTAALSQASTPDDVGGVVVAHAQLVIEAQNVIITRLSPSGDNLEILNIGPIDGGVVEPWQTFPADAAVPLADVARTRTALFIESREEWVAMYPGLAATLEETGHRASIVAPLVVDGRVLGAIGFAFGEPRAFDEETRALALTVAQQCAQALDRSRLLEAERLARREAEAANRAKSDFLAIMSHELRTPLNAIGGYVELLEMEVRGPLTDAQRKDLGRIQASQRHLLGLINEVLNYAKLESGKVSYDITDVATTGALEDAASLVAPQAKAKGLDLFTSACPSEVTARCDPEKLQQILVNLLSNAVKFTDHGHIELSCRADDDRVRLLVRDTGIGIARDQLEKVFEPFVQVRAALTRTAEGTGLGLAISRDLARAMKGDLLVESQVGRGSTFTLVLPRGEDRPGA